MDESASYALGGDDGEALWCFGTTCATILLGRGIHPKLVQELLSHVTVAMTLDTYSHYLPSMGDQASGAMEVVVRRDSRLGFGRADGLVASLVSDGTVRTAALEAKSARPCSASPCATATADGSRTRSSRACSPCCSPVRSAGP